MSNKTGRSVWGIALVLLCQCAHPTTNIPKAGRLAVRTTRGHTGALFDSVDKAAMHACKYIRDNYPDHVRLEYAGCIFRDDAGIRVGLPETSGLRGFCMTPDPPPGTVLLGNFHNQPDSEMFSDVDINTKLMLPLYLCAPSGQVYRYTPSDGKTVEVTE